MSDRIPGSSYDNPIWYRGYRIFVGPYPEWGAAHEFVSDNYDGAPDAFDDRAGYEPSVEACKSRIDEIEEGHADALLKQRKNGSWPRLSAKRASPMTPEAIKETCALITVSAFCAAVVVFSAGIAG